MSTKYRLYERKTYLHYLLWAFVNITDLTAIRGCNITCKRIQYLTNDISNTVTWIYLRTHTRPRPPTPPHTPRTHARARTHTHTHTHTHTMTAVCVLPSWSVQTLGLQYNTLFRSWILLIFFSVVLLGKSRNLLMDSSSIWQSSIRCLRHSSPTSCMLHPHKSFFSKDIFTLFPKSILYNYVQFVIALMIKWKILFLRSHFPLSWP
jgi:hypothetical protein